MKTEKVGKFAVLISLALVVTGAASGATPPVLHFESEVALGRGVGTIPEYGNGLLVTHDFDTASIWAADDRGQVVMEARLAAPGVSLFQIHDVASRADGVTAVPMSAVSEGRWTSLMLWYSKSGALLRVVKTDHFGIFSLAFAPDGVLWTVGIQKDESYKFVEGHDLIRRYDKDGRLIDSLLPVSSMSPSIRHPGPQGQECWLAPASDRMGLFCAQTGDWFEINLAGQIVKRLKVANQPANVDFLGAAMLNGKAYLCGRQSSARPGTKLYQMDRESGRLTPVAPAKAEDEARGLLVVGVTKDKLVVLRDNKLAFARVE